MDAERRVTAQEQNSAGDNRSLAAQIQQLSATIAQIPISSSANSRAEGFGITGGYVMYASILIPVPQGKTTASVLCVGSGSAVDATTGGLTTAYGRCVIGASTSGAFPAAKDAGASQVNNVITATHASTFGVVPGSTILVGFEMYGLNGAAYPARPTNFASISAVATFYS